MQQPYHCVWIGRVGGWHVSVCVWWRLVCGCAAQCARPCNQGAEWVFGRCAAGWAGWMINDRTDCRLLCCSQQHLCQLLLLRDPGCPFYQVMYSFLFDQGSDGVLVLLLVVGDHVTC